MKRTHTPGRTLLLLMGAGMLFASVPARAVEWSAEPYMSLNTLYTDNFTLTTDAHEEVFGFQFVPGIRLNGESEIWKVSAGANLKFNRFHQQEFNTTEGAVGANAAYRAERNTYGLNLQFIRDNTLVGELATTGIAQSFTPRTQLIFNPSFTRALTESTKLIVGYDFTSVNYADTIGTSLIDYREQRLTASIEHSLNERTKAVVTGYYDFFQTDPDNFNTHSAGVEGGVIQEFSETLHASLMAGPRTTHSTTSAQAPVCSGLIVNGICQGTVITLATEESSDSTGFTLNTEVTKRWRETGSISLRAGRELNPSGAGALVQTDALRLLLTRELSEKWTAVLDAGVYRSKYVGTSIGENKARYLRVEPRVGWRVAPGWEVDAGYIYARQKYDLDTRAATANTVYVTISYSWQKIAMSR